MTKRAFIWDLDGTLLDSYNAILAGLEETYATYQLPFDRASINDFILKHSVQDLLVAMAEEYHLDVTDLNHRRAESLAEKNAQVLLMDGARDVLSWDKKLELSSLSIPIRERMPLSSCGTWAWNLFLQRF